MSQFKTFFVRHTRKLSISDEMVKSFASEHRIALHYPGPGPVDSNKLDLESYKVRGDRVAMRALVELARDGGYVWAEYRTTRVAQIGFIPPNSTIELEESEWVRHHPGRTAILKTLPLQKVRKVMPRELLALRATRPRQGTIARWKKARRTVEKLVERESLNFSLELLSPGQLETMCAEFLRSGDTGLPGLDALLMPVGMTMKDVDFVGLTDRGRQVLAQVTHYSLDSASGKKKLNNLVGYDAPDVELFLFCRTEDAVEREGVHVVPLQVVEEWLMSRPVVVKALTPSVAD